MGSARCAGQNRNEQVVSHQFCTYFDSAYLPQGLALYESLQRHCPSFNLWILCLDDLCHSLLRQMELPDTQLVRLEEFECGDDALLEAKTNRSRVEYYFTCTPSLILYLLRDRVNADRLSYLDADLFFYEDPALLFDEMDCGSIAIIEHRWPPGSPQIKEGGIFNVGFLSFRRDRHAQECLGWWRERCLEWCYDRVEEDRFADQKYLDEWPRRFGQVVVLQRKGAGVGPWNVGNCSVRWDGARVRIGGDPLIFYHFSGIKQLAWGTYQTGLGSRPTNGLSVVLRHIYRPYMEAVLRARRRIQASEPAPVSATGESTRRSSWVRQRRTLWMDVGRAVSSPGRMGTACVRLLRGQVVLVVGERVWW